MVEEFFTGLRVRLTELLGNRYVVKFETGMSGVGCEYYMSVVFEGLSVVREAGILVEVHRGVMYLMPIGDVIVEPVRWHELSLVEIGLCGPEVDPVERVVWYMRELRLVR